MKRSYSIAIYVVIVTISSAFLVALPLSDFLSHNSALEDAKNIPNGNFGVIQHYNDSLSDSNGNRAFPWGIEIWSGKPSSYFENNLVKLTGYSKNDAAVLAIPDPVDKIPVKPGVSYTQSFEIKLVNVQDGVRLMYQSFNSSDSEAHRIIQTNYGTFERGNSDWHTISFTATTVNGSAVGDIIFELRGPGTVYVRSPKFHTTTPIDTVQQTVSNSTTYLVAAFVLFIVVTGAITLISLFVIPLKQKISNRRQIKT